MGMIKRKTLLQKVSVSFRSTGDISDQDDYRRGFLNLGIDILNLIIPCCGVLSSVL